MRNLIGNTNSLPVSGPLPYGGVKDDTGTNNGTPVAERLLGDQLQFFMKLMDLGGVSLNNLPENATNGYQLTTALINIIIAQATTLVNAEATARANADTTLNIAKVDRAGDTFMGDVSMNGNFIHLLNNPASNQDAATKIYVDGVVSTEATARSNADLLLAAKAQGAWTNITLLNGWATVANTPTPGYRQNQFGKYEFRGQIDGVVASGGGIASGLPAPSGFSAGAGPIFPITDGNGTSPNLFAGVTSGGALTVSSFGVSSRTDLSGISYY